MRAFEAGDLGEATTFYRGVSDANARALLDFLIDHPEERFDEAGLADRVGFAEHRLVARSTYAMGLALRELGFGRPWTEAQSGYLMPAEAATLLREARTAANG